MQRLNYANQSTAQSVTHFTTVDLHQLFRIIIGIHYFVGKQQTHQTFQHFLIICVHLCITSKERQRCGMQCSLYHCTEVHSHSTAHWPSRSLHWILVARESSLDYRCRSLWNQQLYWSHCVYHLQEQQGVHHS